MSGNVWQLMQNKYANESDTRALRGSSWGSSVNNLRAVDRISADPTVQGNNIGFRVARTLP